jgi:hypothetical protein
MAPLWGNLLSEFLLAVRICDIFGNIPLRWNQLSQKFTVKPLRFLKFNKFLYNLAIINTLIVGLQTILFWETSSKLASMFAMLMICGYSTALFSTFSTYKWPTLLCSLLNSMISFENRWKFEYQKANRIIGKLICACALGSHMQIPLSLGVFVVPCMPVFPGFWILKECRATQSTFQNSSYLLNTLVKVFIAVFTFCGCHSTILTTCMFQLCLIFLQGYNFAKYTKGYIQAVQQQLKLNGSREVLWAIQVFRELQLMVTTYHRQLTSRSVLIGFVLIGPVVQIMANYILIQLIRGKSQLPTAFIINLGAMAFVTFCILFQATGFLSMVYQESKDIQKELRRNARNKGFRRFCRSCPVLKVSLGGSGNFFEPDTSLNVEQFSMNQTINLLLADV